MGKKKVIHKSGDQKVAVETAALKPAKESSKRVDTGRVYINASFNNTLITISDEKGNAMAWGSAGQLGFSGPKKATPFAASKVIAALAEKLKKAGPVNVHVYVNGVGSGRDSAIRSLSNQGFNVLTIRDVTPIPHNGPRPPKVRRV